MSLKPYKFIVKAVPQIVDVDGEVTGEELGVEPVELIGVRQAILWLEQFPIALAKAEAQVKPLGESSEPTSKQRRHEAK